MYITDWVFQPNIMYLASDLLMQFSYHALAILQRFRCSTTDNPRGFAPVNLEWPDSSTYNEIRSNISAPRLSNPWAVGSSAPTRLIFRRPSLFNSVPRNSSTQYTATWDSASVACGSCGYKWSKDHCLQIHTLAGNGWEHHGHGVEAHRVSRNCDDDTTSTKFFMFHPCRTVI